MVAVLLAEEHHRAEPARFVDRRDEGAHRQVLEDLLVDEVLNSLPLFVRQLLRMREVEAKLVRAHGRARLLDVLAEHVAQRLVQEVRRGVVRHRREADGPGDNSSNPVAFGKRVTLEEQHLILLEPVGLSQLGADAGVVVTLDPAGVGDLAAARGIERRLPQLGEEEPVTHVLDCTELRQHLDLLVADELAAKAGALGELGRALVVLRDRSTRASPLLLHQPGELLVVDSEPSFARELEGQLEREAVRVVQPEGVLA